MLYNINKIYKKGFLEPIMELLNFQQNNIKALDSINKDQLMSYQKEIVNLNKTISLDPNNADHFENRGDLYLKSDQPLKALYDYLTANNLDHDDDINTARCLCARAEIFNKANFLSDAWQDYECAVGFDILNPYYYFRRGCVEIKLNKINKAIKSFQSASGYKNGGEPGELPEIKVIKKSKKTLIFCRYTVKKLI